MATIVPYLGAIVTQCGRLVTRSAAADGDKCQPNPTETSSGSAATAERPQRPTGGESVSQQPEQDELSRMDDFEVIRERQEVMTALAELTNRYKRLNYEMSRRETLQWMVAP